MNIYLGGRLPDLNDAGSEKNKKKTKIFLIVAGFIIISMIVSSLILGD
ncbi:hypothetical protein N9C10_00670 [Flavobacteriaceae bacterium]|jgi:hypothetical protein|nr:hypothetical protein [Flavobacteriaceae bacterium]